MKRFITVKNILIALLVGIVAFQKCDGDSKKNKPETVKVDGKKYEVIKHIIDTQEIVKTKIKYTKGDSIPYEVIVTDTVYRPLNIDTLALINEYFAKHIYRDTLKLNDDLGTVVLVDTITKNRIESRLWTANVKEKVVKETTIVKEPAKRQVFAGFNSTFNRQDLVQSVGAGLVYKTKKDQLYQVTGGLTGNGTSSAPTIPFVGVGVYWKIGAKK